MISKYKKKTNIGIGVGIILQIIGRVLLGPDEVGSLALAMGYLAHFTGLGFFIWGCMSYSKAKGHHPAWGFLGLLSVVGFVVLFFFKDKNK